MATVSYTHLGVVLAVEHEGLERRVRISLRRGHAPDDLLQHRGDAVSYTHLDVYKRQLVGMTLAVFADVGVMVLAVLNSLRTLKVRAL